MLILLGGFLFVYLFRPKKVFFVLFNVAMWSGLLGSVFTWPVSLVDKMTLPEGRVG
jgi:hypothetical protein